MNLEGSETKVQKKLTTTTNEVGGHLGHLGTPAAGRRSERGDWSRRRVCFLIVCFSEAGEV